MLNIIHCVVYISNSAFNGGGGMPHIGLQHDILRFYNVGGGGYTGGNGTVNWRLPAAAEVR